MLLDRTRAVAALPRLLPERSQRERALVLVRELLGTTGRADAAAWERLAAVSRALGVGDAEAAAPATARPKARPRRRASAAAPVAKPAPRAPRGSRKGAA